MINRDQPPPPDQTAATDAPGSIAGAWAGNPKTDHLDVAEIAKNFAGRRPKLRFSLFRDLDPNPQKDWLVEEWLGANELSCFFGAPGSSKSTLVGDLAFKVAAGDQWFGRRTKCGGVLILAAERAHVVEKRLAALRKHYNLDDIPLAVVKGGMDLCTRANDIKEIEGWSKWLERLSGLPTVLIIVDTVSRVFAGREENSSTDMGALVANLAQLQERTGAHVLTVHHTPADRERPRGHGSLLAACDATVLVKEQRDYFTAVMDKANDVASGKGVAYRLRSIDLHFNPETGVTTDAPIVEAITEPVPRYAPVITAKERIMLGILAEAGDRGLSLKELNKHARKEGMGIERPADLNEVRNTLLKKRLISEHGGVFRLYASSARAGDETA